MRAFEVLFAVAASVAVVRGGQQIERGVVLRVMEQRQ